MPELLRRILRRQHPRETGWCWRCEEYVYMDQHQHEEATP